MPRQAKVQAKRNMFVDSPSENVLTILRYIKDWDLKLLLNQLKRSHAHDF